MAARRAPGCRIRRVPRCARREHWRIPVHSQAAPARPDNPNRRAGRRETRFDERAPAFLSTAAPLRPAPTIRPTDLLLSRRIGADVSRAPAICARPRSTPRKGMATRWSHRKAPAIPAPMTTRPRRHYALPPPICSLHFLTIGQEDWEWLRLLPITP